PAHGLREDQSRRGSVRRDDRLHRTGEAAARRRDAGAARSGTLRRRLDPGTAGRAALKRKGGGSRGPAPRCGTAPRAPGRLELLASALRHVGLEALLAHALEEGRVRFGLDDPIELAAVGRDEAHAIDLQIVDAPATVPEMEPVVERDLATAVRENLRPHGGV